MNSKRVYFGLLGIIGLLLLALLGGAYGVNTLLQSKSNALVSLKSQNQTLENEQTNLVAAKKQVQQYTDVNNIAQKIVPQDKDQAEAVREISNLATESGIGQLSSVTFPMSNLGGTTPATSSSNNKSNLTQLTPVTGISGLYQLQITIQQTAESTVPYSQLLTFLDKLEQNRRTAQITSVNITPDSKNPTYVSFTLIINEFIRP